MTKTMVFDLTVIRDESCFDSSEWRELLAHDPDAHIFATPEWGGLWWEEFGEDKDLYILVMRRAGKVEAVVPLYRKVEDGRKILRFIGGIDLTDYIGPICSLEARADVADTLVDWLSSDEIEWDEFDAHNMPVPFGFAEFLAERAHSSDFEFLLKQEETSAVMLLPGDWDEYLQTLKAKERHELRRKRRRLHREHPDATFRRSTPETLEADLRSFVHMHRDASGLKGHFMRPEIATFFERIARAFMKLGWLRLDFLEVGGNPIASTFGFQFGSTFYLYNSAYEPEAGRLSPGFVLVSELVRTAIDDGLVSFDFLRGPERYKYQLGAQPVPLHNVRVLRATSG